VPRGNIHGRLERLRERVGPPDNPGASETRKRVRQALETIHRLILEHADEINADYRQRVDEGEEDRPALIAAKREAITATEEGRQAREIFESILEQRGRGDT
jgi:hypothetical protein